MCRFAILFLCLLHVTILVCANTIHHVDDDSNNDSITTKNDTKIHTKPLKKEVIVPFLGFIALIVFGCVFLIAVRFSHSIYLSHVDHQISTYGPTPRQRRAIAAKRVRLESLARGQTRPGRILVI